MHAVVNHLHLIKPVDEFRDIVQNEALPLLSNMPGFIGFHFVKVDDYNAIILIIWEDAAAAQAGAKSMGPSWFVPHIKPFLSSPEGRKTGDIIVSSYK